MATVVYSDAATWTCLNGVTQLTRVQCWGRGGYGASRSQYAGVGGGGGGGAYAERSNVSVTPGNGYTVGNSNGMFYFTSDGPVYTRGRAGITASSAAGASGGTADPSDGTTYYNGGNGASGSGNAGGGGGGAGPLGAGGNASDEVGGDSSSVGGGNGGNGTTTSTWPNNNGFAGYAPGGGGGGAMGGQYYGNGGAPGSGQVILTFTVPPPSAPTIQAPSSDSAAAPGVQVTLTATCPSSTSGLPVSMYWFYRRDGGTYTYLGNSSQVAIGQQATTTWNTTGYPVGEYVLYVSARDEYGTESDDTQCDYTVTLRTVELSSPENLRQQWGAGITFTGMGWLPGAGQLYMQWEVDTNNPPSAASPNYHVLTSELVSQGVDASVAGSFPQAATWYFRARTKDTSATPVYSAWTAVQSFTVLGLLEIIAPTPAEAKVAGIVMFTGRGWLTTAGDVALEWEIDTNDPPESASPNYQNLVSAHVAQAASVTVAAFLDLGIYHLRVRTLDAADPPNAGTWTATQELRVLKQIRLLAGSTVEEGVLQAANKIYARVKGTSTVASATYEEEGDPMSYSVSPREDVVILPGGDATAAQTVASDTVARRHVDQRHMSGLEVSLVDGMLLQRGQLVGVQIDRMGVDGTYPIRELLFDIGAAKCTVVVGEWNAPRDDVDTLINVAQRVDKLEREGA